MKLDVRVTDVAKFVQQWTNTKKIIVSGILIEV